MHLSAMAAVHSGGTITTRGILTISTTPIIIRIITTPTALAGDITTGLTDLITENVIMGLAITETQYATAGLEVLEL